MRDLRVVETATLVMVLLILLVVYRKVATILLVLASIGVSQAAATQVVAGLAELGLGISQQTMVFMSAMMIGAGVDYAVFLISRYHEYLRQGMDSDQAVARALTAIGKVIAASAATVAVTFLGMSFTTLRVFSTTGPALAVSIAVAFLAAITLLPAMLVLGGRRGWFRPKRELTDRFWRRSGIHIVRRPGAHLAASLAILIPLAACVLALQTSYDARTSLPPTAESNSEWPRSNAISRPVSPLRSTSSSSPRTTCERPRRWRISSRWHSGSVSCRISRRCRASPGPPAHRWSRRR